MNERINIIVTFPNIGTVNYELYDAVTTLEESFANDEQSLAWYVLECIANDPRFENAVRIVAQSTVYQGSKVIATAAATVRA